jgi:hypothetical protein
MKSVSGRRISAFIKICTHGRAGRSAATGGAGESTCPAAHTRVHCLPWHHRQGRATAHARWEAGTRARAAAGPATAAADMHAAATHFTHDWDLGSGRRILVETEQRQVGLEVVRALGHLPAARRERASQIAGGGADAQAGSRHSQHPPRAAHAHPACGLPRPQAARRVARTRSPAVTAGRADTAEAAHVARQAGNGPAATCSSTYASSRGVRISASKRSRPPSSSAISACIVALVRRH